MKNLFNHISLLFIFFFIDVQANISRGTVFKNSCRPNNPIRRVVPLRGGFISSPHVRDLGCAALGLSGASIWLKIWTSLAAAGHINPKDSRKIIHSGSAPLFLLTWPFFSQDSSARVIASIVPTVFAARLVLAHRGRQPDLVKAISRSGSDKEALGGPFLYCAVLIAITLLWWRSSLALVAIAQLAVGDGLADIVGRRWGASNKWPFAFASKKSVAGSAAFVLGGLVASFALISWFGAFASPLEGLASLPTLALLSRLGAISVVAAVVELLPLGDDNLTVPLAAAICVRLLER